MNDFIFNERNNADLPRLSICGFTENYSHMLYMLMCNDFNITNADPQIVIADEGCEIKWQNIPIIVIGKTESKKRNRIYLRRPVELKRLRDMAVALISVSLPDTRNENSLLADPDALTVSYGNRTETLTSLEFDLFSILYAKQGEAVSREEIKSKLWPDSDNTNICDVYICYLRKKLEKLMGKGIIVALRGKGYMMQNVNK